MAPERAYLMPNEMSDTNTPRPIDSDGSTHEARPSHSVIDNPTMAEIEEFFSEPDPHVEARLRRVMEIEDSERLGHVIIAVVENQSKEK